MAMMSLTRIFVPTLSPAQHSTLVVPLRPATQLHLTTRRFRLFFSLHEQWIILGVVPIHGEAAQSGGNGEEHATAAFLVSSRIT